MNKVREISWQTGTDSDGYPHGGYVTRHSTGDWTDNPGRGGVRVENRPDEMSEAEWILASLPVGAVPVTILTGN